MLNAFAVIACLETFAAKCALKVLTELDFKKLEHMIWEMNIALDERNFPHYVELQEKFHAYCANATGNKTLIEILNYVKRQYPRQSYYSKEGNILYAALGKSNAEHAEILQALRNKDIAKIEELLTQHWCWQKPEAHTMGRTPSSPAQ